MIPRNGQSSASVEVDLWNGGEDSYRKDVYGETITIFRSVSSGGGGNYKIKDSKGKVVVTKKAKEELERILSAFRIQVWEITLHLMP